MYNINMRLQLSWIKRSATNRKTGGSNPSRRTKIHQIRDVSFFISKDDEDELKETFDRKEIIKEEFDKAYQISNESMEKVKENTDKVLKFTDKYLKEIL